jgi:hypothetical protein
MLAHQNWMLFQVISQTRCITSIEKIDSAAKYRVFNSLMMRQVLLTRGRRLFNVCFQARPACKSVFAGNCELRTAELESAEKISASLAFLKCG